MSITKDYKEFSFNQLHELIGNLYKEIDRLTAERKASDQALDKLSGNVSFGYSAIKTIEKTIKETVLQAIAESKIKKKVVITGKAKRKK